MWLFRRNNARDEYDKLVSLGSSYKEDAAAMSITCHIAYKNFFAAAELARSKKLGVDKESGAAKNAYNVALKAGDMAFNLSDYAAAAMWYGNAFKSATVFDLGEGASSKAIDCAKRTVEEQRKLRLRR